VLPGLKGGAGPQPIIESDLGSMRVPARGEAQSGSSAEPAHTNLAQAAAQPIDIGGLEKNQHADGAALRASGVGLIR